MAITTKKKMSKKTGTSPKPRNTPRSGGSSSPVTKTGGSSSSEKVKFYKKPSGIAILLVIIAGSAISIGYGVSLLAIGNISGTPAKNVSVQIVNAASFDNMTIKYSATAFVVNGSAPIDNKTFQFYRSWIVGVNGSAANLRLHLGDTFNGKNITGFVLKFVTNASGYGVWSDFSVFIVKNARYYLKVYKDPTSTSVSTSYDKGNSTFYITSQVSNPDDSAYYASWNPGKFNDTMSYLLVNVTFDKDVVWSPLPTPSSPYNITILQCTGVLQDQTGYGMQNILPYPAASNITKSVIYMVWLARGVQSWSFSTIPTIANITSISLWYATTKLATATI